MQAPAKKTRIQKRPVAQQVVATSHAEPQGISITDNRPEAIAQRKLMANIQSNKPVAQRVRVPFKRPAAPNANDLLVAANIAAIDAATTAAYQNTFNQLAAANPALGGAAVPLAQANFPGVSNGHYANFINVLNGNSNALKAAAAGYVIEDQVSNGVLPAGVQTQVHLAGGAIPDFVSTHGASRGFIDITSTGQAGHVLNKNFNQGGFSYIEETVYPSINFNALAGAAPVVAAGGLALAAQARAQQANNRLRSEVHAQRRMINLLNSGVMRNNRTFERASMRARIFMVRMLSRANWTHAQIRTVNRYIYAANTILNRRGVGIRLRTMTNIIDGIQDRYGVGGRPMW